LKSILEFLSERNDIGIVSEVGIVADKIIGKLNDKVDIITSVRDADGVLSIPDETYNSDTQLMIDRTYIGIVVEVFGEPTTVIFTTRQVDESRLINRGEKGGEYKRKTDNYLNTPIIWLFDNTEESYDSFGELLRTINKKPQSPVAIRKTAAKVRKIIKTTIARKRDTLIHELIHMYDDLRSDSKIFKPNVKSDARRSGELIGRKQVLSNGISGIDIVKYVTNEWEFNAHFLVAVQKFIESGAHVDSFDEFKDKIKLRDSIDYRQLPETHRKRFLTRLYDLYTKVKN
jgi:hypothetical protein